MAVDFHAHLGREDPEAPPFMRALFDVEGYLERQAAAGIDLTILSYALEDPEGRNDQQELDRAKGEHEFLAETIGRHASLAAFVTVDPFGGKGWLDDAAQALDSGFAGICLPTSRSGRYLDSEEAQDALSFANDRGALVLLHPSDVPLELERVGDAVLGGWIGRPYDTGICLSRLLLANTLASYPDLQMVVVHCGGVVPMLLGRLDQVYESFKRRAAMMGGGGPPGEGPPGGGPPGEGPPGGGPPGGAPGNGPPKLPKEFARPADEYALNASVDGGPPSERLLQLPIHFDTASYHPTAVRAAIDTLGIDRVVLGTDYPPAGDSPAPVVELIDRLGLAPEDREKILSGNAARLVKTPIPDTQKEA